MKYRFFGKNIEPSCAYCAHGRLSATKEKVLCEKKGVQSLSASCRAFAYDPLRRIPQTAKLDRSYDPKDFQL